MLAQRALLSEHAQSSFLGLVSDYLRHRYGLQMSEDAADAPGSGQIYIKERRVYLSKAKLSSYYQTFAFKGMEEVKDVLDKALAPVLADDASGQAPSPRN